MLRILILQGSDIVSFDTTPLVNLEYLDVSYSEIVTIDTVPLK